MALCAAPAAAGPWLFITDLHFDPANHWSYPTWPGMDSNEALVDSMLREAQRVDPDPPVVVIGGDEFAHHFDWSHAPQTMAFLARRFGAAFPNAQFVVTLGNEDSACGDYEIAPSSPFMRAVARDWEPLVNRHGAAPGFATTFPRDGFYTARLPIAHTTAVVIDDVFWSPRYRACGPRKADPAAAAFADVRRALRANGDRHWIVLHIPPGIDAYSTAHLTHRLVVVPFLDPGWRSALLATIADPRANVALVVAAHAHKFAFRIAGTAARPVPIVIVPSVSPVFMNRAGFLTAQVDADGTLRDVDTYGLAPSGWQNLGGFRALGVTRVTGAALVDLQHRLDRDPALRRRYALLYQGGAPPEFDDRNWSVYACAATAFSSEAFRACAGSGGVSVLTSRGVIAAVAAVVLLVAAGIFGWSRRRRGTRGESDARRRNRPVS